MLYGVALQSVQTHKVTVASCLPTQVICVRNQCLVLLLLMRGGESSIAVSEKFQSRHLVVSCHWMLSAYVFDILALIEIWSRS
jgi:hypothetical protein